MGWLANGVFREVVNHAPLVSIDLIVRDMKTGRVLLGRRNNSPAENYFFVPGGRIQKNETFEDAFCRLTEEELGVRLGLDDSKFHGVYEHFYDDSIFGGAVSTHYVVIARRLDIDATVLSPPKCQHDRYLWTLPVDLLKESSVHPFTKAYFGKSPANSVFFER